MVTKLEDFLRRRSKIALVARMEDIKASPGLMDACRILFGDAAQEKFDEYFQERQQAEEIFGQPESLGKHSRAENPAHSETLSWKLGGEARKTD
jgi:glycerol-3-phosphate dehydrogenase